MKPCIAFSPRFVKDYTEDELVLTSEHAQLKCVNLGLSSMDGITTPINFFFGRALVQADAARVHYGSNCWLLSTMRLLDQFTSEGLLVL